MAFDGDGDRLGVISPDGSIIWPDRQLILYARDVLSRNPGAEIIYDVKCSRTVGEAIRQAGGKATMWMTGHSFIKKKLKETGAALAGEMSGHTFFKERWYGFDDGLYTAARLLELLSRDPRAPKDVFAALPNTVNTPELHLKLAEGEHYALIKELVAKASFPDARITTIDGLRADFDDGFGLVRASNTTPVLVFRFEGDNATALERIQGLFRSLVAAARPGLKLPF
jgi:phosphomannomutase/phosphoglucomutase